MKNVLVLVAHPHLAESKANKAMMESIQGLPGVTIRDLYGEPFTADNYREDFSRADVIVFQFPFYWGSSPALLKQWLDEIFMSFFEVPGAAGKQLMIATTTGSEYEAYRAGGRDHFTIDELLRPFEFTALYAGMDYLTPFVIYSTAASDADRYITEGASRYAVYIRQIQESGYK